MNLIIGVSVVKHESSRFASVGDGHVQRPAPAQNRAFYQVNSHDWFKSNSGLGGGGFTVPASPVRQQPSGPAPSRRFSKAITSASRKHIECKRGMEVRINSG